MDAGLFILIMSTIAFISYRFGATNASDDLAPSEDANRDDCLCRHCPYNPHGCNEEIV